MVDTQTDVAILRFMPRPINKLKVLRAEHTLTQYQAAEKARISQHRYWRIENGWTKPTAEEVQRLARLFKCEVSELREVAA